MRKTLKSFILSIIILSTTLIGLTFFFIWSEKDHTVTYDSSNLLAIPPLVDSKEQGHDINLDIINTKHRFFDGKESETKGFSQSYLGPTIRLYKGENTTISFTNKIADMTTVHGHGLHVDGSVDGGPQSKIKPGTTKTVTIPTTQEAGLSWYHPHLMGKTAEHVHSGLAGLYIIEDQNSLNLALPKTYGTDDIPLIVQDRTFIDGAMKPLKVDNEQILNGLREETLITNGTVNPYQITPKGWVRLRLLNASNARFYKFFFEGNIPFYKIATEGGFLNAPVEINQLVMSPGERNEIVVDLSNVETLKLQAEFQSADPEAVDYEDVEDLMEIGELFSVLVPQELPVQTVVEFRTDPALASVASLPQQLNDITAFTANDIENAVRRSFVLDMDMAEDAGPITHDNMLSINGAPMKMNVINERVKKGDVEIWTITAEMMPHPFHIHGVSFLILSQNGKPPKEEDKGWKDTLIVSDIPSEVVMRFNHTATDEYPYMYHCHILEHEDMGMMGQFTVM